ncbi:hypothetical protein BLNAU_18258 [Blattamonas nauphoetae]|uniref:Uncharacterized protein n=1 Tax=Blattamonas nauphoetae TaxID=2049346 RepID=A0ABQ9X536_9EUKA|nr:hypothetical protein BLNAU_18258 [Blattamonas nauphoetae]
MPSRRRVSKMSEELSKRDGPKSGDIGQIDEENISEDGESANHTRFSDKQDILSEELIQDQLRMSDLEFGRLSGGLVHSRSENDAEWERTDTHPPHHPPTTLSPTSALLCRKPSTLRISILTPPRLVHSHTHFTLLLLPNTKNLVSRLISREIDIGVTAFITETTRMRKEGKEKRRNDAQASSSPFGSPPVPTPTSMLTPSPPSPLSKLTLPPSPFNKSLPRWKDVLSYRTFPSCGKLNVALSRPLLSCSAGTLVISPSSFTATDQSQLTVPLVCSSPLSSSASNSATDQMRIEMEEVEFSNLNVDGSVDGVVQIEGADSLRLKKVDFSNVKNGASDAVRIFVMGAEKDGMWCGEADFPCRSLNEADKHLKHALPSTMEVQTSAVLHSELDLTHDITKITSGSGEKGRVDVSREGCLVNQTDTPTHSDSVLLHRPFAVPRLLPESTPSPSDGWTARGGMSNTWRSDGLNDYASKATSRRVRNGEKTSGNEGGEDFPLAYYVYPHVEGDPIHVSAYYWDRQTCGRPKLPCTTLSYAVSCVTSKTEVVTLITNLSINSRIEVPSCGTAISSNGPSGEKLTLTLDVSAQFSVKDGDLGLSNIILLLPSSLAIPVFVVDGKTLTLSSTATIQNPSSALTHSTALVSLSSGSIFVDSASFDFNTPFVSTAALVEQTGGSLEMNGVNIASVTRSSGNGAVVNWVIIFQKLLASYFCVSLEICLTILIVCIYPFNQHTEDFCWR